MKLRFIEERLEHYKNKVLAALDSNDSIEAIKNRAVQKELEELLKIIATMDVIIFDDYYSTEETAKICDRTPKHMTRYAPTWGARDVNGQWFFPKSVVEHKKGELNRTGKKRGRKPKPK